ncbi:bifunctional heparan sulfate N-deacetylase N-sulfotransferase 3-like [Pelobates cultripes]|uniref:Bifunctional heparan sulfate N-deacetylase N-sulfotransferase 3-like n=1 Tax=Pelobates cultripes TaxID=61616 RepID=A0AAD1RUX1_PELCU|nr:bifunctional heparan sulfate N-deacetylase N-sulfotransferase 3-like [Pelobates cultripes]
MATRETADQRQDLKPPTKKDREKKDKQEKRLSNFFNAPADKSTLENSQTSTPYKAVLSKETADFSVTEAKEPSDEQQTVTPGYLKECLDLQLEQIKTEMQANFATLKKDILEIGQKVKVNEQKIENFEFLLQKQNEIIEKQQTKINDLEERTINIEERARRNNLRIRNIPESISQDNLATYLSEFFKVLKINIEDKVDFRLSLLRF